MPAFPRAKDLAWSEWLPRFRAGVKVPANLLSYRYRAVKVSQPIRTETIGPFDVATIASGFFEVQHDEHTLNGASAQFAVRYRGKPLIIDAKIDRTSDSTERVERFDNVAVLAGPRSAASANHGFVPRHGSVLCRRRERRFAPHRASHRVRHRDARRPAHDGHRAVPRRRRAKAGAWKNRSNELLAAGTFSLCRARYSTRGSSSCTDSSADTTVSNNPYLPPFGLSPDERSFVTYGTTSDSPPAPLVVVTDYIANRTYTLPIDPARMRYAKLESLDPAWLNHHFVWQRGRDGVDRLIERPGFVPIPYHGELSVERGGNRTYRLDKGTEALRGALIEFIVKEFSGARQAADSGAYEIPVKIGARIVNVAFSSGSSYVSVSMDRSNTDDSSLVASIAERFDAALATGRYDSLFAK